MVHDVGLFALAIAFSLFVYTTLIAVYGGLLDRPVWVQETRDATFAVFGLLAISYLN